jgi:cytosine/adenosine deaminase-related metal-dependent hydrolase
VQSVDLIVTNIDRLITVDPGRRIIRDAAIAANGGKFVSLDKSAAIAKANSAGRTIDAGSTMATTGLVDCHLHSSFHLARGLADEANAQSLLFDRMYHYEAALDSDDVHLSATLADAKLLKRG